VPSFDVVCKLDLQEVDNGIHQTLQELVRRFDFRGVKTEVVREDQMVKIHSADDFKVRSVGEILKERLAKRQVPLKALDEKEIEPGPVGTAKQEIVLQQGIASDKAKEIVKLIKDAKLKVQASIQADQVRVKGKSKDELQGAMKVLRDSALDFDMQFTNYR
jgi:uncharacterized protein YajQ (UPF0234 family)